MAAFGGLFFVESTFKLCIVLMGRGTRRLTMEKTILIVEDNTLNRRLIGDILQCEGYRTLEARDVAEGLAAARANAPDLILMDVRLPDGSGLDLARTIKAERPVPIVVVTALALDGDAEAIRASGCDGHIEKPFSTRTLLDAVDGILRA